MKKIFLLLIGCLYLSNVAFATPGPVTTAGSITICNGNPIYVPVTVADFNNVGGISLTLNYDDAILQFENVVLNPAISGSSTNGSDPGIFKLGYNSLTAINLDGNYILFTLEFSYSGLPAGGTSSITWNETPPGDNEYSTPEGVAYDQDPFGDYFIAGYVTVSPSECGGPVTIAPVMTICPSSEISVPVTIADFMDVGGISLTLNYDPAILEFQNVDLNPAISGSSTNGSDPGVFILGYNSLAGINLADYDTLFTLHFSYAGTPAGGTSPLTWNETPPGDNEYSTPDGIAYNKYPFENYFIDGSVTVKSATSCFASILLTKTGILDLSIVPPATTAEAGDQISYNFTVTNAGNVTLTNVMVTDLVVIVSGGAITLAPGETDNTNFTAIYTIQPDDILAGTFTNTATVTGYDPDGNEVADTDDDTQIFPIIQSDRFEMGDAPEGVFAYPGLGVMGHFPTCKEDGNGLFISHLQAQDIDTLYFGSLIDYEEEGNGGICSSFDPYNNDEFISDSDAGLLMPTVFTVDNMQNIVTTASPVISLGMVCSLANWGSNIDITLHNNSTLSAYVNVLIDWTMDGNWANDALCTCGPQPAPEHVLVNFLIPPGYAGPLSGLNPPGFQIGPDYGHVWVRLSITERPVIINWDGSGEFEAGETEDYLLFVSPYTIVPLSNWALFLGIGLMIITTVFIYRRRMNS